MTAHEELAELLAKYPRGVMVPPGLAVRLIEDFEHVRGHLRDGTIPEDRGDEPLVVQATDGVIE